MRLSDEAAEAAKQLDGHEYTKIGREWCESEAGIDAIATAFGAMPYRIMMVKLPSAIYAMMRNENAFHESLASCWFSIGRALNECWLACGGEERVNAAYAAGHAAGVEEAANVCEVLGGQADTTILEDGRPHRKCAAAIRVLPTPASPTVGS